MIPKVSIIFPTLNGWSDTRNCLLSINQLGYPQVKIEVIVVDNGSKDETISKIKNYSKKTVSLVKRYKFKIKLIENKKNLGFARAVNQGIKISAGDYLLITNNDVVFAKNYLKRLVNFLMENPAIGIVGGKVYYKNPKNSLAFPGARFNFYTGLLRPSKHHKKISTTDWVPGCNLLMRKSLIDKIGYFDEKFFFYFEDLDFCLRAKQAGFQIIYYPKAILWHGEGISIAREDWRKKSDYYYQGKTRILFKYATPIQLLSALIFEFLLGLPYHLVILKHPNYKPAIKALIKNIKEVVYKS